MPKRLLADAAPALGNAALRGINADIMICMCWVHVWRAVAAQHARLKTDSDPRRKELFTDLNFIHNLTEVALIPHAWWRFDVKWRTKYGEASMADYIKNEWTRKSSSGDAVEKAS